MKKLTIKQQLRVNLWRRYASGGITQKTYDIAFAELARGGYSYRQGSIEQYIDALVAQASRSQYVYDRQAGSWVVKGIAS